MNDTRADSGSPEAIVRASGKIRRAVPEELADAHPPHCPDRTHVVRHARGGGGLRGSGKRLVLRGWVTPVPRDPSVFQSGLHKSLCPFSFDGSLL